jgi:hypothetical protein
MGDGQSARLRSHRTTCTRSIACTSTPYFTWNSPNKGELKACAIAVHKIGLLVKNAVQNVQLGEQGVDTHGSVERLVARPDWEGACWFPRALTLGLACVELKRNLINANVANQGQQ